jgi:hypothetical protein
LDDDDDEEEDMGITRAWENITDNIRTSATESLCCNEMKHHKIWLHEDCLKLLDERKAG